MSEIVIQDVSWEKFATVKRWKKQLGMRSHKGELSQNTWSNCRFWMIRFLKCTKMNPDDLIEEAIRDSENGEEKLSDFYNWLIKNDKQQPNSANTGSYGVIRGFFSRNKVHTQGWMTPKLQPRLVEQTDADYPIFTVNPKTKKLDLNRTLLQSFYKKLSERDEIISLCLLSSGLDDGDLFKLNIGFVTRQNPEHERLFLSGARGKTGELFKTFFSKEATKRLRRYIATERRGASDSEPLFITSVKSRKETFTKTNKRQFKNVVGDDLPPGLRLRPKALSQNYRNAQESFGIKLESNKQGPLRPKRLRKGFRNGCQIAGLNDDLVSIFMGHSGSMSKIYLERPREYLEQFYKMAEPYLSVYAVPSESEEMQVLDKKNTELEKRLNELQVALTKQTSFKIDASDYEKYYHIFQKALDDTVNKKKNE